MTIQTFRPRVGASRYSSAVSSRKDFGHAIKDQLQAVIDNYIGWVKSIDGQMAEILLEALEPTFQWSQEIVPVHTGALKDSGYLETGTFRGHTTVDMGYAKGGTPPYAVYVHEALTYFHEPPTQAKFLQAPIEWDANNIQLRVQQGIATAAGVGSVQA